MKTCAPSILSSGRERQGGRRHPQALIGHRQPPLHLPPPPGRLRCRSHPLPYATAFAANGMSIPVYLTAHADEFGGPVPCAGFGLIGGEEIGKLVVENIGSAPACLLKNHGVFTIGPSGKAAVKAAVMVEDIARTVWFARQLGQPGRNPRRYGCQTASPLHPRIRPVMACRCFPDLLALGVRPGGVLLVHSSLRSLGRWRAAPRRSSRAAGGAWRGGHAAVAGAVLRQRRRRQPGL